MRFGFLRTVLTVLALCAQNNAIPFYPNSGADIYAVGFDLTPSYGTVSIQLAENTFVSLGRVNGSDEYKSMMARLALPSSRHMAYPYEWWHDGGALAGWEDIPRVELRSFRKSIGLPASHDTGIISEMLDALKEQAEIFLASRFNGGKSLTPTNFTVKSAVVSSPELDGLYDEDVIDAADFSGIQLLSSEWYSRQPLHVHAYRNAYGLDFFAPKNPNLRGRAIMLVSLTEHGLEISQKVRRTNQTCTLSWGQQAGWFSSDLGASPDFGEDEAQNRNWTARVKELLTSCYNHRHHSAYVYGVNTSDVLFAGESGANLILRRTILEVVAESQPNAPDVVVWPRPRQTYSSKGFLQKNGVVDQSIFRSEADVSLMEYGGSIGAASMAWDILYGSLPTNISANECWSEQRAEANVEVKSYGITFWNYLAELPVDGGWAVWEKACCTIAPICPLPMC